MVFRKTASHIALAAAVVIIAVVPGVGVGHEGASFRHLLNHSDHIFIARALAEGEDSTQFIIACAPSATQSLAGGLSANGVTIDNSIAKLGYIRATIPFSRLPHVLQMSTIQAIDVLPLNQYDYDLQGKEPEEPRTRDIPPVDLPTPGPHTAMNNPFTALSSMGVPQFLAQHPTYDGRGVTIGLLESVDPLAPGLQEARTIDGHIVPKIVEFRVNETPFESISGGGTRNIRFGWVDMRRIVHTRNGDFEYGGIRYRTPYDGTFHFGFWSLTDYGFAQFREPDYAAGRAIVPRLTFPILWDEANGNVWINAHQDGDFATGRAIGDYRSIQDVGGLPVTTQWNKMGASTQGGPPSHVTHFIVQTDGQDHFLRFDLTGLWHHGSMVAGSAAGNGFFAGAFNGVAPGARIAIVEGYYPYLIEGLYALATSKVKVDVISASFGLTQYADDDGVLNRIIDRFIRIYNIPMCFSAANSGPAAQRVEMPSTASEAISVGGYVSAKAARYDEGAIFPYYDGMLALYSSRGPSNDGAMKPDIVAQTEWLTAGTSERPPEAFRQNLYLPRGYMLGGGTSQAAPTLAGTIALLMSAAKQDGISYTAKTLKQALLASAHRLSEQPFETGSGLVNVPGAWAILKHVSTSQLPCIIARAPVETVRSAVLPDPGVGRGMYLRGGWVPGAMGTRAITYTLERDAVAGTQKYAVRIIGNDSTFRSVRFIVLRPGIPTRLVMRIHPKSAGIHSAIVELVNARTETVVDERLCTVIAAERFTAVDGYQIAHNGSVPHPGVNRYFFAVPRGTTVFTVDATADKGLSSTFNSYSGGNFIHVTRPDGTAPPSGFMPINQGLRWAQEFEHPQPGVWEVDVQNEDPGEYSAPTLTHASPIQATHYEMQATIYRVSALRISHSSHELHVLLRNEMAPLHVNSKTIELAHVHQVSISVQSGDEPQLVPFQVPSQTSQVFAQLLSAPKGAHVNIYLFNCAKNVAAQREVYFSREGCILAGSAGWFQHTSLASTTDPQSWVSALYPSQTVPSGRWVVAVDDERSASNIPVMLRIGTVSADSKKELVSVSDKLEPSGGQWETMASIPKLDDASDHLAMLLSLQADETVEFWEKHPADTIDKEEKVIPQTSYRFGSVWSSIISL